MRTAVEPLPGSPPEHTMIRSLAMAGVLAALAAAAAFAVSQQATWNAIAAWIGWPERTPEAVLATENWPICTTMAAYRSRSKRHAIMATRNGFAIDDAGARPQPGRSAGVLVGQQRVQFVLGELVELAGARPSQRVQFACQPGRPSRATPLHPRCIASRMLDRDSAALTNLRVSTRPLAG